jgi:mono/diheme cytochrome c family protein
MGCAEERSLWKRSRRVRAGRRALPPGCRECGGCAEGRRREDRREGRLHEDRAARSRQADAKGQLKNPYNESQADIVADGEHKFLSYSCNGCHGGGGGGGMCPPLTNDVWVYDGDDDTLFRLVTLGSDELQKAGYSRHGSENVVGPMPPFGTLIKSSDDLFRILTFVRSKYSPNADPHYKYGTPADQK